MEGKLDIKVRVIFLFNEIFRFLLGFQVIIDGESGFFIYLISWWVWEILGLSLRLEVKGRLSYFVKQIEKSLGGGVFQRN